MKAAFAWSEVYATGFADVDAQHQRLVAMVNQIAAHDSVPGPEVLDALTDYAAQHFSDEEALMARSRLAPASVAEHVAQHRAFVAEVLSMRQHGAAGSDLATTQRFLASWLAFHILGTDRAMAAQIRLIEAGMDAEEAHVRSRHAQDGAAVQPLLDALASLYSVVSVRKEALAAQVAERTAELQHERNELAAVLKQVERSQSQLLQSEKMAAVGQLAAGVAHEINNPVGFVSSNIGTLSTYVQRLFEVLDAYAALKAERGSVATQARLASVLATADLDYLREDVVALIKESQDGLNRVKRIVSDLKDFSHVDEAQWQLADLNAGLESTLNVVWSELKYKAQIVRNLGELPPVPCIAAQINQVFLNLLVNAGQAIESQGTITLATRVDGGQAVVEIADTGHGIPPETLSRIFEPFYTTKPVGKGTGLGLSIAWDIVAKHDGRLSVRSKPGDGTCFELRLPLNNPNYPKESGHA
ncbi:ATP-binding protein [Ideonella sp. A 288]|uniref:ATP-binding protein n=1 Tax=Ideonella sp. A 288 TaxID=1962181 RepID=UPI000B4C07C3|nr:ATP-binding protein [Ideonella sp. A 288]